MSDLNAIYAQMRSLVIFRDLLSDPVIQRFMNMLEAEDSVSFTATCADFEAGLYEVTDNWSDYLLHAVMNSENVAVRMKAEGRTSDRIEETLRRELKVLGQAASLTPSDFSLLSPAVFAGWNNSPCDLESVYEARLGEVAQKGYGIFADYHVFTLSQAGLEPVAYPDPQRLSELPGYEPERKKIVANVQALLEGKPAVNMLLYGDAGTGKSSTIKALANEYADRGLRLVEVRKNQLYQIPSLLEHLASMPLKFMIFIDDLSFSSNDDNFAALKAILEGSVSHPAGNTIIAATSNRRHLVKESVSDRFLDDLHENDTRQELLSLSARFGLIVTFQKPDRNRYLYIVQELVKEYGVEIEEEELTSKAETYAIRAGGRSPRVARQFVEQLKSGVL
ncbi:MAG: DUF815 domain-containing protein [Solobacterium sp.]|nr:DUF815 domain-containing protein [Solobacterium sp.]